ncbi:type I secretion system permease/ATPase [Microvirga lotononidis]|uniref:Type I secretion system ABC transporter, PrtD family n=1 Tax=Microvirga lotononidis TaxID=864069 RepID=I4YLD6_9HYPH|nr:type I secretion system permease/ATPase [Microvirga lotononidis]EIM24778.1 type I secretion system ABC transporter, PrtD family [Microvirga lotononidis]WQO25415.1 type I secretion system permease/ATPase [Microvirga lotononidis]
MSKTANSQAADILHQGRKAFAVGVAYAAALSAVINVLQLIVPLFMLQVHDRVVNSQSTDTLIMLIIVSAIGLVIYCILDYVRALTYQVMASKLVRKLNLPVLEAAISASVTKGISKSGQSIRDLNDIRTFIVGSAISVPLEAFWAPIFLAVLFALHWLYGLVALVSATIIISLSLLSDFLTRRAMKRANESSLQNISEIGGTLRHAEAIEAMGMLPALSERWRHSQLHTQDLLDVVTRRSRAMASFTRTCRYAMQIAVLSVGAILVIKQEVSPGSMVASSIIMGRMLLPFDSMVDGWRQWVLAISAWKNVSDLIEHQAPKRETKPTPRTQGDLTVDRLVYAPPGSDVPVLKGISFTLAPGEVLGIVGPSAAGKSTLARALIGVTKPTSGGVYLDGNNVYLWERGSFGDMVGYLPQSVSLLDGTIRDNIARMRDSDPRLVLEAARLADVHEMIGRLPLGYDTPLGDGGLALSGGQRQRIGLARAIYGKPRLIVLDEPNSNLDTDGERALVRTIEALRADGAIIILIAHRPSVMQAADKLMVLQEGRISQFGPRTSVVSTITPGEKPIAAVKGSA